MSRLRRSSVPLLVLEVLRKPNGRHGADQAHLVSKAPANCWISRLLGVDGLLGVAGAHPVRVSSVTVIGSVDPLVGDAIECRGCNRVRTSGRSSVLGSPAVEGTVPSLSVGGLALNSAGVSCTLAASVVPTSRIRARGNQANHAMELQGL